MKPRFSCGGAKPVLNWERHFIQINPRTYVPRIIRPKPHTPFVRYVQSNVDVDHMQLRNCCGKHHVGGGQILYVHRIAEQPKMLK